MDISEQAVDYIKKITKSKELFLKYADDKKYAPFPVPLTLFMAGSPGAGKTETSKYLILNLKNFLSQKSEIDYSVVRIDADEIREKCPGYDGQNAHLFQAAASLGVNKLYDYVIKRKFNVLVDGTFSNSRYAQANIEIALNKKREVYIYYIFQEPERAWEFTLKRERLQNRKITMDTFISSFIGAKDNVNEVKRLYKDKIKINLIKKDYENNIEKVWLNIDNIDNFIKFDYTKQAIFGRIKDIKLK